VIGEKKRKKRRVSGVIDVISRISNVYPTSQIMRQVLIYAAGVATPILLRYLVRYVKGRRELAEGVR